jgi:hypothetical protein
MKIYRNRIVAFDNEDKLDVGVVDRVAEEWCNRWFDRDSGKILIAGQRSEALSDTPQIARGAQLIATCLIGRYPEIPEEAILLGGEWKSVRGSFVSNQKRHRDFFKTVADEDRRLSLVAHKERLGRIASIGAKALRWVEEDEDEDDEGTHDRFRKLAVREPVDEGAVAIPSRRPLIEIEFGDMLAQTGDI